MRAYGSALFLLALPLVFSLSACEGTEDQALATAQSCLNSATAATVDTCLMPIAGQTSAASYSIRCSADFIAQGFDATRLESAFQDLSSGNTTTKPMLTAVAYMAFYPGLATGHTAANAVNNCTLSQADSYRRIAEFSQYATTMAAQASTTAQTPATAKATISGELALPANSALQTNVGAQTLVLYDDFCVKKSPFSGTDICTEIANYKDLATNQLIGFGIMTYLSN